MEFEQYTEEQYTLAVEKVKKNQRASVISIQQLGMKYTPAAMIIDRMEKEGLISGYLGKTPRKVFVK